MNTPLDSNSGKCTTLTVNDLLTYILVFFLCVLVFYVIVYMWRTIKQRRGETFTDGKQPVTKRNKIIGLFMAGCPYCVQFKPVFESVVHEFASNPDFTRDWTVVVENDTNAAKREYGVSSFPTVVIEKKNKERDVSVGSMSAEAFRAFIKRNMV